jgi:LemA protein
MPRCSAAGLGFRIIPAGFNAPLEFLTGFTSISKRRGKMTWIIIFIILAILVIAVVTIYNKLVRLRNTVKSSWSDIDVQCKKRYDLVPNLVETVKGYASHEKTVFEKVTEARAMAMQANSPAEMAKAENMIRDTLKSLFAVAEAYPELKANANFMQLQTQLQELENNIENARRYYNAVVRDFNILIESFPSNLIATSFNFKQAELFQLEAPEAERKPVKVSFS